MLKNIFKSFILFSFILSVVLFTPFLQGCQSPSDTSNDSYNTKQKTSVNATDGNSNVSDEDKIEDLTVSDIPMTGSPLYAIQSYTITTPDVSYTTDYSYDSLSHGVSSMLVSSSDIMISETGYKRNDDGTIISTMTDANNQTVNQKVETTVEETDDTYDVSVKFYNQETTTNSNISEDISQTSTSAESENSTASNVLTDAETQNYVSSSLYSFDINDGVLKVSSQIAPFGNAGIVDTMSTFMNKGLPTKIDMMYTKTNNDDNADNGNVIKYTTTFDWSSVTTQNMGTVEIMSVSSAGGEPMLEIYRVVYDVSMGNMPVKIESWDGDYSIELEYKRIDEPDSALSYGESYGEIARAMNGFIGYRYNIFPSNAL